MRTKKPTIMTKMTTRALSPPELSKEACTVKNTRTVETKIRKMRSS